MRKQVQEEPTQRKQDPDGVWKKEEMIGEMQGICRVGKPAEKPEKVDEKRKRRQQELTSTGLSNQEELTMHTSDLASTVAVEHDPPLPGDPTLALLCPKISSPPNLSPACDAEGGKKEPRADAWVEEGA